MDTEQIELFPAVGYVDRSHGMTARSTRFKTPPKHRKAIASSKNAIALQTPKTLTIKDFKHHGTVHNLR